MSVVLWLLLAQGVVGAFDTLYFHEFRVRLPARGALAVRELKLHAARDFLYAVLFASLPRVAWLGGWTFVLIAILLAEIVITLADFVIEARDRKSFGDVASGERVTHSVMGICYGAMLANFVPLLYQWSSEPTGFAKLSTPATLTVVLTLMAAGVFISGLRDLYAALRLPHSEWPWRSHETA